MVNAQVTLLHHLASFVWVLISASFIGVRWVGVLLRYDDGHTGVMVMLLNLLVLLKYWLYSPQDGHTSVMVMLLNLIVV